MAFHTIDDVKRANRALGHHWFDPATLRFFNSRIIPPLEKGRYFVTSERFDSSTPRRYTVRVAYCDGRVETVGDFMHYATLRDARKAIRMMI